MARRRLARRLSAWLIAACLLPPAACGGKQSEYIKDLHVEPQRVVSESQQLLPIEVAYYLPSASATRTEAVALSKTGNFRVHVGELIDRAFRENLSQVYRNVSVLPNDLFSKQQRPFDYPGYIVPEIRDVAINPVNQSVRLVVDVALYLEGRRKVGELHLESRAAPLSLDPATLPEADRRVLEGGTQTERLVLALQHAAADLVKDFVVGHARLLKPVRSQGKLFFVSGYNVPLDVDFKPSSPTHLADTEALNGLRRMVSILQRNPTLRMRIEVHAFDYLGKPTENIPKILGPKRAEVLRNYLVQEGVSASRIDTLSYQDFYPIAENTDPAGWNKNDRVDFVILR